MEFWCLAKLAGQELSQTAMPPQLEKVITSPSIIAMWAMLLLVLSAFLVKPAWHGLFASVPEETALKRAEGTLTSFRQYTNEEGLRFQLSGSDSFFVLSSYSGAEPAVRRAPPGARFAVLYDPSRLKAPAWTNRQSFVAYVVYVDGSPVRSYQQVAADASRDIAWTPWAGSVFGLGGLFLLGWAGKLRFLRARPAPVGVPEAPSEPHNAG